jgi:dCMP deaminase
MILALAFMPASCPLASSLAECGFTLLDLDALVPLPVSQAEALAGPLGPDFRARLAALRIDPLKNTLVAPVRNAAEAVLLAAVAPAGLAFEKGGLDPQSHVALSRAGVPAMEASRDADRNAATRLVMALSARLPRVSWDAYFMDIASRVAARSDCVKRKVAALIVKEKRIISTGYNGTPRGAANCSAGGCPRCARFEQSGSALGDCLCSHGEENAITQAAYHGISVKGATLYCTNSPCLLCTKMIINAGIVEVVYSSAYPLGERSLELLEEAKVTCRQT